MALIAYLMEFKGNYGPHLIIVPNAVMVNWKVIFQLLHFSDNFLLSSVPLNRKTFRSLCRVSCILGYHLCHAFFMLEGRITGQNYIHR